MNIYVVMNVSNNFNNIISIHVEFYNQKTLLLIVFGFGLFVISISISIYIYIIVNVILYNVEIVI